MENGSDNLDGINDARFIRLSPEPLEDTRSRGWTHSGKARDRASLAQPEGLSTSVHGSPEDKVTSILERYEKRQEVAPRDNADGEPAAISSIPTSVGAISCKRLIRFLPHEALSLINAILANKDEAKLIDSLHRDHAQIFINMVHDALDLPDISSSLRKKYLSVLCRVCGRHALLPKSLQMPLCYNRSELPRCSGGCADVWMGEHRGMPVAAKVLRVYSMSDFGRITRRFCKEVVTWGVLRHPNVLPLFGATMDKDNYRFVMVSEWMSNGNINEFIKAHRDVNRFELLQDVTKGLMYMHSQEMLHGDLKGANILIDQGRRARLADFGFLAIISDPANPTASSSSTTGGTWRWMSPELLDPVRFYPKHGRPTIESDCYALGMVIYEVLSGQAPFTPFKDVIALQKVVEGERPERPVGEERTWFADDLWGMLHLSWETQPEIRPEIKAVLKCLERASGSWKPLTQ